MSLVFGAVARWRPLAALILVMPVILPACAQPDSRVSTGADPQLQLVRDWHSSLYSEHPLVGTLYSTAQDRRITVDEFTRSITGARFLLLGEKHDNPDHHEIQRLILDYLLSSQRVAAVSFEMIDTSSDSRLSSLDQAPNESLASLKEFLNWDEDGWDWEFYGPLIAAALTAEVPVRSANISQTQVSEVYARPPDSESANVLDADAIEQLNREIDASHCNMLPPSQFPAMVRVQQARDQQMASSLAAAVAPDRLNVLIAGNYHVRRDLGVPRYLMHLLPDTQPEDVVSVALLEVDPDTENPKDYLESYADLAPYDLVWFTPAISDEDYCASLAR